MKQHQKWLMIALAVAGGLVITSSARAQAVTGTPYLSNLNPTYLTLYADWATPDATINILPTGMQVIDNGPAYGSCYYDAWDAGQSQTLNTGDLFAVLTFTVNDVPANYIWVGTPFILGDNYGAVTYGSYSGSGNGGNPSTVTWNGDVVTWTVPFVAGQVAAIQAGNDTIYGFNLEFDPAVLTAGSYNVTFNSLVLEVPEPTTLALLALGVTGFVIARRRISVS